jgi:molybdate transport system substrate-binding protein
MNQLIMAGLAGLAFFAAALNLHAAQVIVFAAASLTDSLKEIASAYEKQSGDKIVFNFAASGLLARQIQEGAPADVFFSADESKMNALEQRDLLVKGTRVNLLGNTLVVIVPADSTNVPVSANDLASPSVKRLALGEPKIVPAGAYAKSFLEKQKLWPAIEPKVVPCENVRAVLAAVESGNVDAGIVYQTDAAISRKVRAAFAVPPAQGPQINYSLALIKESKEPAAAGNFIKWLTSKFADDVFRKAGFIVLAPSSTP